LIYSRFDLFVAVSEAVANSLENLLPQISEKIVVIYNVINPAYLQNTETKSDIRRRLDLDERKHVIFASGNFRYAKGFDLLLESMVVLLDRCRQEDSTLKTLPILLITGEGGLQDSIVNLSKRLGIQDNVRFLGFRKDMPEILKAADLFVLPSRWEGCPMVVLESMALGLPVLATDVGGVPELVAHQQTGFLVSPGSSSALANGLYKLISDSEWAACLAEQGQQRLAQLFSTNKSVLEMTTQYRQLVGLVI
jgi:glycosyltransferase involved in cell wall biosynthesis